jgi:hypothetical protein
MVIFNSYVKLPEGNSGIWENVYILVILVVWVG